MWKEDQRFVRLFVKEDEKSVLVSVGVFRLAYALPAVVEGELIQRRLLNVLEIKVPWIQRVLGQAANRMDELFLRNAFAASASCKPSSPAWPGCLSSTWSAPASPTLAGGVGKLGKIGDRLDEDLDNLNDTAGGIRDELHGLNTTLSETGKGLEDTLDSNVDEIVRTFRDESNDIQELIGDEADQTQKMVDDEIAHLNDEIDEIQDQMDSYATLAEEKFDEATALLKSTSDSGSSSSNPRRARRTSAS